MMQDKIVQHMQTIAAALSEYQRVSETANTAIKHALMLDQIHALLDGQHWSSDTLERIGDIFIRNGFDIASPFDEQWNENAERIADAKTYDDTQ